jgi:hypothetical protein
LDSLISDVYSNRAYIKTILNDFQGALNDYTKQIELDPLNPIVYSNRGATNIILNQKQNGCLDLQKAKDLGCDFVKEKIIEYCK